jgi:hypothetical protein
MKPSTFQDSVFSGFASTLNGVVQAARRRKPGLLASRAFWVGGLLSAALWAAVALLVLG